MEVASITSTISVTPLIKLALVKTPPRKWAHTQYLTLLQVPPQQGYDCAICVNEMFRIIASNPDKFITSR